SQYLQLCHAPWVFTALSRAMATAHASAAACGARLAAAEGIWQVARELRPAGLDSVCWRLVLGEVLLGLLVGAGRRGWGRRGTEVGSPGCEWPPPKAG